MRQQLTAMVREMYAFPLAVKKLAGQIRLQGLDPVADGGLREMQLAPSLGETAAAGEGEKSAKLPGIERLVHEFHSYIM